MAELGHVNITNSDRGILPRPGGLARNASNDGGGLAEQAALGGPMAEGAVASSDSVPEVIHIPPLP